MFTFSAREPWEDEERLTEANHLKRKNDDEGDGNDQPTKRARAIAVSSDAEAAMHYPDSQPFPTTTPETVGGVCTPHEVASLKRSIAELQAEAAAARRERDCADCDSANLQDELVALNIKLGEAYEENEALRSKYEGYKSPSDIDNMFRRIREMHQLMLEDEHRKFDKQREETAEKHRADMTRTHQEHQRMIAAVVSERDHLRNAVASTLNTELQIQSANVVLEQVALFMEQLKKCFMDYTSGVTSAYTLLQQHFLPISQRVPAMRGLYTRLDSAYKEHERRVLGRRTGDGAAREQLRKYADGHVAQALQPYNPMVRQSLGEFLQYVEVFSGMLSDQVKREEELKNTLMCCLDEVDRINA